jgi:glutamate-ammonia-ligase adenylyltransferase
MPAMRSEFLNITFADTARAEVNLAEVTKRLPEGLFAPLASLLAHSPDPDGALNLFERYLQAAPPELPQTIAASPTALTYLVAIFGYSSVLAETFLSHPSLALQFATEKNFTRLKSREDLMQDYARFSTTQTDLWLSAHLAQFKRRNYLRLVLKDVLRISTLAETTFELSALADVILANALLYCDQELKKRYGEPQYRDAQGRIAISRFAIVSLGKLGGNELNYSSDIDLLFLYSNDGETSGGNEPDSIITNKEYFIRLANAITRTITQSTPYGQVFRVDLRLRPEGDQGDLTISLRSALEYYEHRARDWELQMLIKARHSAGDERLTRQFLHGVESYIYGTPADFTAIESVLLARERISKKLRESRHDSIDVKLHRGGIRDIEFLAQCLQRLHGGRDPWVRSGGTLLALRKLNDKGLISDEDFASLTTAYEFLRKVEHRIQLDMGQQSHRLPSDPAALYRLACRVQMDGTPDAAPPPSKGSPGELLVEQLQAVFHKVDSIYERIIHPRAALAPPQTFNLHPPSSLDGAALVNFPDALAFLESQSPDLARHLREAQLSARARPNLARFLASLYASPEAFSQAIKHPDLWAHALQVIGTSDYLADLLIHHPEDMVCLEMLNGDGPIPALQALFELEPPAGSVARFAPYAWAGNRNWDVREQMSMLRRQFRTEKIALGGHDCREAEPVAVMLRRWSLSAGRCISSALEAAYSALAQTGARVNALQAPFMILGLGRLGLTEFDLGSDADLVFICSNAVSEEERGFYTQVAGKMIEVLSAYTRDGTLFSVDTRLRPLGQEGELVVTEEGLLGYLATTAQAWEGLTYLKALPIAGNLQLGDHLAGCIEQQVYERFNGDPRLEDRLLDMRRRLEREVAASASNPKTAPGGIYDVDYAVSYVRLKHQVHIEPGHSLAGQARMLAGNNLLGHEDAQAFLEGVCFLRSFDHAARLVTGRSAEGLPTHAGHAEMVEQILRRWGLIEGGGSSASLAALLRHTQSSVRGVYRRVVGAE